MSKPITKVPHGEGQVCLAFSTDGKHAYTGGQDCVVLIWRLDEGDDQEPERAIQADDAITSITTTHDCWLSGSKDGIVRRYPRGSSRYEGDVTDMSGVPVRHVAIDAKGKRVAVASDDVVVRVVDLEDSIKVTELKGHQRGVRKATWHPKLPLLTTCGSDGKIIAWDVSSEEPVIIATIEGIIPSVADTESPEFDHDCSAVWHPGGQQFFVASRSHEIVTISQSNWSKASTFTNKDIVGVITALAISPNGKYLASSTPTRVHPTAGCDVLQVAFSPRENLLTWADKQGHYTRWPKPIPDNMASPTNSDHSASGLGLFDDTAQLDGHPVEEEDANLDSEMGDVDDLLDDPNFLIDDLGTELRDEPEKTKNLGYIKEMVSITKAQSSFQPGSTPFLNKKRYLAYNAIGVIEVTQQDAHQIINVDFFDHSMRKGFHFIDRSLYDLGYLGESGALFACPPEDDHLAHVCFKPYDQWSLQREWTYELCRKGSRVLGVAAGALPPSSSFRQNDDSDLQGYGNIVIATSENDLTFLSGSGRERRIMGLGAEFVAMIAGAEWALVVHREGSTTIDGSQNLSYSIINFEDFSIRQHGILPIPKDHILKWIGLTDQGAPVIYDSTGYVHMLTKYRIPHHASWARIMDTNLLERRIGKDETYWPIGVTSNIFFCLILKGRQQYPGFPRPLIQELPLRMPFRRQEQKEEFVERELLFLQDHLDSLDDELTTDAIVAKERSLDKELIQLIQMACKDPADIARAIELTKLLHYTTSIDAAIKIAEFYHLVSLKEKTQAIKDDREEREDRLVIARNKRRRWLKPDPPLREINTTTNRARRVDPLAETFPPPTIERPGITRVTVPVLESSQFAKQDGLKSQIAVNKDESFVAENRVLGESKRKREIEDEPQESEPFMMPPLKQKVNPFAKKPGQDGPRNPFARKPDTNRVIHKSESFFEKVDAADTAGSQKFNRSLFMKDKKGGRQTTLFGMMKNRGQIAEQDIDSNLDMAISQETEIETQLTSTTDITNDGSGDWQKPQSDEDNAETQLTDDFSN
ncbi:hypothetical protein AMATHDRAFT_2572 [Amanita thiersii Skay4041]|uniref:Uncharacterized protein n=1 Tax=Amanita thiersii Skay4041 TaxID=703135 RepID=A0A2A9NWJ3_9AGAR|nr:hypothetical protein AMATHDRAFT_2572 [Amanita thiersii Skay4041]